MAKTDGYSRLACDRKTCDTVEYLQGNDPRTGSWKTVKRLTSDLSLIHISEPTRLELI